MTESPRTVLGLAAQIVTAHVRHNDMATNEVPNLIRSVYSALSDIDLKASPPSMDSAPECPDHTYHGHEYRNNGRHHHPEVSGPEDGLGHNAYVHPTHGQTVFEDRLICMEDGLSMKMLKRHLLTVHGMTPEEYRAKWGLPDDYPMVALNYARLRSNLALKSGLGLKPEVRPGKQRSTRQGGANARPQARPE